MKLALLALDRAAVADRVVQAPRVGPRRPKLRARVDTDRKAREANYARLRRLDAVWSAQCLCRCAGVWAAVAVHGTQGSLPRLSTALAQTIVLNPRSVSSCYARWCCRRQAACACRVCRCSSCIAAVAGGASPAGRHCRSKQTVAFCWRQGSVSLCSSRLSHTHTHAKMVDKVHSLCNAIAVLDCYCTTMHLHAYEPSIRGQHHRCTARLSSAAPSRQEVVGEEGGGVDGGARDGLADVACAQTVQSGAHAILQTGISGCT